MTKYKFVAVLNKKIEIGKVMNALAHATVGIMSELNSIDDAEIINYMDKDGNSHKASKNPYIILRAKNSNKIREFRNELKEKKIFFSSFTDKMTIGTFEEQINASKETLESELKYYAVVAFGKKKDIDELTKKFSLWQ